MTKKIVSALMCLVLLFALPVCVSAQTMEPERVLVSDEGGALGDGVPEVITIYVTVHKSSSRAASETITADKTSTGKVGGEVVWTYTITGDFTYNGSSARASNPSDDYDIYSSDWSCTSHSVRASGASIIGSATFTSDNGVRKSVSPKMTCSATGTIS